MYETTPELFHEAIYYPLSNAWSRFPFSLVCISPPPHISSRLIVKVIRPNLIHSYLAVWDCWPKQIQYLFSCFSFPSFFTSLSFFSRKATHVAIGLTHYLRHWDDVTLNANAPAKFAVISHFVIAQRNDVDYDIAGARQMQIGCPHRAKRMISSRWTKGIERNAGLEKRYELICTRLRRRAGARIIILWRSVNASVDVWMGVSRTRRRALVIRNVCDMR